MSNSILLGINSEYSFEIMENEMPANLTRVYTQTTGRAAPNNPRFVHVSLTSGPPTHLDTSQPSRVTIAHRCIIAAPKPSLRANPWV